MKINKKTILTSFILLGLMAFILTSFEFLYGILLPGLEVVPRKSFDSNKPPVLLAVLKGTAANPLKGPLDVAVNEKGWIYVADSGNSKIQVFDKNGRFLIQFGHFGSLPGEFDYPVCLAIDDQGQVYIGEYKNSRIQVFTPNGVLLKVIDQAVASVPVEPMDLIFDKEGRLYAANRDGKILVLSRNGELINIFSQAGSLDGYLSYPNGIAIDSHGHIYVADSGNCRIQVFDSNGVFLKKLEAPAYIFSLPTGIAVDGANRIYAVDTLVHNVSVFDKELSHLFTFGTRGTKEGELNFPNGIMIKDGRIFAADRENNRIAIYGYSGEQRGFNENSIEKN